MLIYHLWFDFKPGFKGMLTSLPIHKCFANYVFLFFYSSLLLVSSLVLNLAVCISAGANVLFSNANCHIMIDAL